MKKLMALVLTLVCVLGLAGCGEDKTVNLDFPFEVADVENIEMYHYSGAPVSAEKKMVVAEEDIKTLYDLFEGLSLEVKEIEELTGAEIKRYCIRHNALERGQDIFMPLALLQMK